MNKLDNNLKKSADLLGQLRVALSVKDEELDQYKEINRANDIKIYNKKFKNRKLKKGISKLEQIIVEEKFHIKELEEKVTKMHKTAGRLNKKIAEKGDALRETKQELKEFQVLLDPGLESDLEELDEEALQEMTTEARE